MKNNNLVLNGIDLSKLDIPQGMTTNTHDLKINGGEFETQTINGEEFLVAPVVLITEGVLNGRLYPANELKRNVQAWNGRPVPVNHPKDQNGNPISANSIDVIRKDVVGSIYGVKFEAKTNSTPARLKGKIYLNVKQVLEKSPELWTEIENNEDIEVSTGLYTQDLDEPGVFNNIKYDQIAINYLPDHLAALPGGIGACSWGDGCGIRSNSKHGAGEEEEEETRGKKKKKKKKIPTTFAAFKKFAKETFGMNIKEEEDAPEESDVENNELSFSQIEVALRGAVMEIRGFDPDSWVWIRQAFDNRFIYSVEGRDQDIKLFEQQYTVDQDDEIVLIGDAVEVEENITFEPVTNDNDTMKGDVMKQEMINKIIANDNNEFTKEDESVLLKMNEETLKGLSCGCDSDGDDSNAGSDDGAQETPETNAEENSESSEEPKEEMVTMSKAELNALVVDTVNQTIKSNSTANDKAPLVAALKENGIELEEEAIKALSVNSLQQMVEKSAPKNNKRVVSHVPGSNLGTNSNDEEEIPDMPDFMAHCLENANN